ncbi:HepT-like ribonuclease domain-containing protein [Bradyrhizobium sp. 200]|uniref:HepT-like ribonuclease domain-containing protein n=1 Tax=Bradyrhizobium sp. 200 TaxID=2782665 RepID=UPI00320AAF94
MPPSVEDRLRDVLEAILDIEAMLADMSLEQFSADNVRRMAAERYLEIACEAARHLPNDVKQRASIGAR